MVHHKFTWGIKRYYSQLRTCLSCLLLFTNHWYRHITWDLYLLAWHWPQMVHRQLQAQDRVRALPASRHPLQIWYAGKAVVSRRLIYCYSLLRSDPSFSDPQPLRGSAPMNENWLKARPSQHGLGWPRDTTLHHFTRPDPEGQCADQQWCSASSLLWSTAYQDAVLQLGKSSFGQKTINATQDPEGQPMSECPHQVRAVGFLGGQKIGDESKLVLFWFSAKLESFDRCVLTLTALCPYTAACVFSLIKILVFLSWPANTRIWGC